MKLYKIPFNKPALTGNELEFIQKAVSSGKISGDGLYTKKCQEFFEGRFHFSKTLMTTSCTDALELSSLLIDIKDGDEVIMPSYTFVSTANPYILRGARIRFCDSSKASPNIDTDLIEELITERTKAIVVVHYAGIAVDMDPVLKLCAKYNLFLIEDAAQAIDSYYKGKTLGSIGDIGAYSFHETKNVNCGEGGLIMINRGDLCLRAEIMREKGTNRSAYFRGEIDKYGWVDVGSSFLPSDLLAAFLYAQLEKLDEIQSYRKRIWSIYHQRLSDKSLHDFFEIQAIPAYATNNAHIFYILCRTSDERSRLIDYLKSQEIYAAFHYQSLHSSHYFSGHHDGRALPNSDRYTNCLLRLPLYFGLGDDQAAFICDKIESFYKK